MNALSLFSGIGGIDLACEWASIKTVAMCEREPFCQKVLHKHWPDVPIYDDVCTLTKERLEADGIGTIDLIHGGYPCQPFSVAGKREGSEDDRHLWPEVRRLIESIRPRWFVGENVAGHVTLGLDEVLSDLGDLGYTAQPFVIPACSVNAQHRRDRVFIVGHAKHDGLPPSKVGRILAQASNDYSKREITAGESEGTGRSGDDEALANPTSQRFSFRGRSEWDKGDEETGAGMEPEFERCGAHVADTSSCGQQGQRKFIESFDSTQDQIWKASESLDVRIRDQWAVEPDVGRVANGVPNRVDRLKSLGNAVVPAQIHPILAAIKQIDDMLRTA